MLGVIVWYGNSEIIIAYSKEALKTVDLSLFRCLDSTYYSNLRTRMLMQFL